MVNYDSSRKYNIWPMAGIMCDTWLIRCWHCSVYGNSLGMPYRTFVAIYFKDNLIYVTGGIILRITYVHFYMLGCTFGKNCSSNSFDKLSSSLVFYMLEFRWHIWSHLTLSHISPTVKWNKIIDLGQIVSATIYFQFALENPIITLSI